MKHLSIILVLFLIVTNVARAESCVSDKNDFDFMATSPTKFHFGKIESVKSAYGNFIDYIGDPGVIGGSSIYYITSDFASFSHAYCEDTKCTGLDILNGLNYCSMYSNKGCYPLAAIYNGKLYCLLDPSPKYYHSSGPFNPFE